MPDVLAMLLDLRRTVRGMLESMRPPRVPYITSADIDPPHMSEGDERYHAAVRLDELLTEAIEEAREL